MRARTVVVAIAVVAAAGMCVRLGFWQLARASEKRAIHDAQSALLALPPIELAEALPGVAPEVGRRARVLGTWKRDQHVLLSGRTYIGAAGVSLVTPVRLASGEHLLVERGWLAAADSRTAHPERSPDSVADVVGVVLPLGSAAHASEWVALPAERAGVELWSARTLDSAHAIEHLSGPLALWSVRALPASGAAPTTSDEPSPKPEPYDVPGESVHLSYAIQWFGFAAVILGGAIALALRRKPSLPLSSTA